MKPYNPDELPLNNLNYRQLLPLVGQANAALARYDGLLQGIPNPAVMLSPLTTQEAVLSSKIEGTQATVDEVLEQEAGLLKEGEKFKDIQEISNYREALYKGRDYLDVYPIRLGFVRELHRILAIQETTHSQYSVHLLDAIFSKPIFRTSDLAQKLTTEYGVHEKTTPGLLRQLKDAGILREIQPGSGRRAATMCFPRLINLAEGRDVL